MSPELLLDIILKELNKKIVGEEMNKKAIILHLAQIWVKNPKIKLHLLESGDTATGKSYLVNKILELFPNELVEKKTRISGTTLNYWKNTKADKDFTWDGKILYLEDVSYSIINNDNVKIFMTEGSDITTVDMNKVAEARAQNIKVKGIPNIVMTSCNSLLKREMASRLNVIHTDESQEQDERVLKFQAESEKNGQDDYSEDVINELKELEQVEVIIPFVDKIPEVFIKNKVKHVRRTYQRFLELIKSSCALNQDEREEDKLGRCIAEKGDYDNAKEVMEYILNINSTINLSNTEQDVWTKSLNFFAEKSEWFSVKEFKDGYKDRVPAIQNLYPIFDKLVRYRLMNYEREEKSKKKLYMPVEYTGKIIELPEFEQIN